MRNVYRNTLNGERSTHHVFGRTLTDLVRPRPLFQILDQIVELPRRLVGKIGEAVALVRTQILTTGQFLSFAGEAPLCPQT